ncbi:hypothetical protein K469DRAFT_613207, partial [Zopfia rhizophila CBS 207.26]
KSKIKPIKYFTYVFYLDRIRIDFRFKEKWTFYYIQYSNINTILNKASNIVIN